MQKLSYGKVTSNGTYFTTAQRRVPQLIVVVPRDGDVAIHQAGDLGERPVREVEVVLRARRTRVGDGDCDALPVVRVGERDGAAAVGGGLVGGAVPRERCGRRCQQ